MPSLLPYFGCKNTPTSLPFISLLLRFAIYVFFRIFATSLPHTKALTGVFKQVHSLSISLGLRQTENNDNEQIDTFDE